jgi:predicted phosphodiesterase
MRFGLIGDVHAEDERLRVTLDAMRTKRVDRILCAGDVADGQGDLEKTCALLRDPSITVVRGNHDRWLREDAVRDLPHAHRMTSISTNAIAFLKSLPASVTLDIPEGKLLLCHGVGDNDMQELKPHDSGYALASNDALLKVLFDPAIAIMACGHTHVPMVRKFERGAGKKPLVVVNAGTLARDDHPGFAVLDTAGMRVDFFRIGDALGIEPVSRGVI